MKVSGNRFCFFILFLLFLSVFSCAAGESGALPNDSEEIALLFGDIQEPLSPDLTPVPDWMPGMRKNFNILDVNSGITGQYESEVFAVASHFVFWCGIEELNAVPADLPAVMQRFDDEIFPLLRETFGTEASPGIDRDPKIHAVFSRGIGMGYNGYFSSEDQADPRVNAISNGMDLVFLNTSLFGQGGNAVINTLAHELQHLIHHAYDPGEMSFINEGFSGLAEYLALDGVRDAFIRNYLNDTGRSLVWWPESGNNGAYYGSSFLFSMYLYDRFGADFIRLAVSMPEKGLDGIDRALELYGVPYSADEVYLQWSAALLAQLEQVRLSSLDYNVFSFPQNGIYRDIQNLPCGETEMHEVSQYGLRFYRGSCDGLCRIRIGGNAESPVTFLQIPGGEAAWWGGALSNAAALLSREFDLSSVSGNVTFSYDVNYDIERNYDYYYLLLRDAAGNVTRLEPSSAAADNPVGLNHGSGTTGNSGGIRHETLDLSPWAGQQIRLTFVYLTDTAGLGDGLLLDNFSIDAVGFFDDAEETGDGWDAQGFSRIHSAVPQLFGLTVLDQMPDGTVSPRFYTFSGGEPFETDCTGSDCVFGISALRRDVRSRASFTVAVSSQSN